MALWLLLVTLQINPSPAPKPTHEDLLLLSRIAVSESNWDSPADHAGIYEVIRATQAKISRKCDCKARFSTAAKQYSSRATGAKPPLNERQAWVSKLGTSPKHRKKFRRIMERSRDVFAGRVRHTCPVRPDHWGGDVDLERVKKFKFIEMSCPGTKNHFYIVHSRAKTLGMIQGR